MIKFKILSLHDFFYLDEINKHTWVFRVLRSIKHRLLSTLFSLSLDSVKQFFHEQREQSKTEKYFKTKCDVLHSSYSNPIGNSKGGEYGRS